METKEETVERTLKANLDTKKANFEEKASDEKKKIYAEGIQSVVDSKIVENALQVGDTAMNFTLKNASNEEVNLYDELEKGPVVLMWYRGGWCPYCNLTLQYMQQSLPEFKEQGANLLALTPELPDSSISTKEKNELEFQVLSDIDNKVAKEYKVVYKLTDDVAKSYENSFELSKYNGNDDAELPLAATYVIGKDKVIKYAFLDAEYRNRAEPKDIIAALKKLNTK
ncbi:AhpC/TSA family protein [Flavobacterium arcticum]|uniref:thioredoxin-dependent peroxiredoxin n=2 Tax=Flavobacterium arcticum TaxID=1784713 RepID=A0A345HFE6_9FLAO|nr:AhpC/TSA family protein [Flavobacterium arcticum]KAF2509807.1 AhpC/TSA family protein [Flavobacterium arcticum]